MLHHSPVEFPDIQTGNSPWSWSNARRDFMNTGLLETSEQSPKKEFWIVH